MSESSTSSSGGIGFAGLLAILFIGLKLGHVIDWTWFWVLSPLWIPMAIAVVILVIALALYVLAAVLGDR